MVLGVLGYQLPIMKAQVLLRQAREKYGRMLGLFRALTLGNKELKMHKARRQEFFDVLFEETASSLRDYNLASVKLYTAAATWGQTLVFVLVGLVIFAVPTLQKVDSALLVACTLTILYLMTPLQFVMNNMPILSRATVSLRKIKELGIQLTEIEEEAATQNRMPNPGWKNLEFEGVTHAYGREGETSSFVLGPLNVSLSRGELLFVTGGNGSGKTTFIKLLTGLYVPETGRISLDDCPITDNNREDYREYFSAVFSDFYLFEELLGLTDVNNRSSEYLERLKLSHKVKIQEGKLSTTDLSQGQRKRLALLTAYLEDRLIYIFDEWAADQDPYFKRIFYLELLPELKQRGKTVVTVTHDDKYFDVADRILKFEEGQLVSDTRTKTVSSIMQSAP
jgi:putative ATP-binding cassette transporter